MTEATPWRRLLGVAVAVVLVVAAGCQSAGTAVDPADSGTSPPLSASPASTAPDPPEEVTNETAKRVALAHEEAYVSGALRAQNYSEWGVGNWQRPSACVLNHSDGGIYVRVEMPYSYQYDGGYVDDGSTATYFVSEERVRRVEGDTVDPL